ncbi:hypothetical protein H0A71_07910 [Alcaligenaceae bacterium]|nr:hypothetical protein [Alcaligenaceae bacterium]
MELFTTPGEVFSAALVFMFGIAVSTWISSYFNVSRKRAILIYIWHTIFCLVYAGYVLVNGGDSLVYYNFLLIEDIEFSVGTTAVKLITVFFKSALGLSFLGTFLIFNIFGFIGLMAFDATLRKATHNKTRNTKLLATLIIFLPSVSFWSSAIGKDSISFMAAGLALWAASNSKRSSGAMVMAIVLMLLVRPHIAALMLLAMAASLIIGRHVPLAQRLVLGGMALVAAAIVIPFALHYAGVGDDVDAGDLITYIEQRQQYNMQGGGGIDIAAMSLPSKLFTYILRPLPFEAHNLFSLAASLDNMVLLLLFILSARNIFKKRVIYLDENRVFLWIYSLLTWFILASTTANLGISVRQKWMFAPMIIFLLISVIDGKHKQTSRSAQQLRN